VTEVREGNLNRIRPVYDPATTVGTASSFTRQPFAGNIIPKNRWYPLFAKLLALYPLPTDNSKIANSSEWHGLQPVVSSMGFSPREAFRPCRAAVRAGLRRPRESPHPSWPPVP
jgi:hypothetical protein